MYKFEKDFPLNADLNENLLSTFHFYWTNCLDTDTVDELIRLGDASRITDAKIGTPDNQDKYDVIRKSRVGWIYRENNETIYNKIIEILIRVNYHNFGFKIDSAEALQYSIYEDAGHYNYHHDIHFSNGYKMRKLSASICLSNASDYQGGELELVHYGDYERNFLKFKMNKGDMVVFPSWVTHKVNPTTSGTRKSIVVWASGPKFS